MSLSTSTLSTITATVPVLGIYTRPRGGEIREVHHGMTVTVTVEVGADHDSPEELAQYVTGAIDSYGTARQGVLHFGNTDAVRLARRLHADLTKIDLTVQSVHWADTPNATATVRTATP